ncbi:hypothetical protein JZ751_021255 [Albula glossodonta]|uniref:Uncharacterized protein n=1 Tax=Albula glossodonta TaxID=121402 RepID=A0A8T2NST5_9TELE|nr:hypothetical protein JZ751_021255 [Albula glossodonta]
MTSESQVTRNTSRGALRETPPQYPHCFCGYWSPNYRAVEGGRGNWHASRLHKAAQRVPDSYRGEARHIKEEPASMPAGLVNVLDARGSPRVPVLLS